MSPHHKLIGDGTVIDIGTEGDTDPRDVQIEQLKAEKRRLEREVSDANLRADRAREDADRALSELRRQLNPLYVALQRVFGELDAAGVTESAAASASSAAPTDSGSKAKWDDWKKRLGPSCAKVIDALLLGGEMNVESIKIAAKLGRDTVYSATSVMGRAGILVKNGGKFSLKSLG